MEQSLSISAQRKVAQLSPYGATDLQKLHNSVRAFFFFFFHLSDLYEEPN